MHPCHRQVCLHLESAVCLHFHSLQHQLCISENESTETPIQDGATSLIPPSQNGFESHYANATQTSGATPPANESGPSPPSLGAIPLATGSNSPNSNLIILNTPPSPTNSKTLLNSNHSDLTHNQLSIPNPMHGLAIGSKKSNSDPVSPNVPWHPELDRRHSDSASFSKDLLNRSHDEVQTSPTYQNTNLTSGNYLTNNLLITHLKFFFLP